MYKTNSCAALYMRLSKEDGAKESQSISTQRRMLKRYASENGFHVIKEYIDDGYSGTNFDRPAFLSMINDIESKVINTVIVKDLSRLGRDYIKSGYYTDVYFPHKRVRLISINDGFDSMQKEDDIIPFKNVINELYARDISRKIRSALKTKMHDGAYIGSFAPYGYRKSPTDKNKLIIDEETSKTVKAIFNLKREGISVSDIADILNKNSIPSPAAYKGISSQNKWTASSIYSILRNPVYLGHTVQGKTRKASHKSKSQLYVPKEEWICVKDTHEAIISYELFHSDKSPNDNIFSGKIHCGTCGKKMSITRSGNIIYFVCSSYKAHGKQVCESHLIRYDEIIDKVKSDMVSKGLLKTDDQLTKTDIEKYIADIEINMDDTEEREKKAPVSVDIKYLHIAQN